MNIRQNRVYSLHELQPYDIAYQACLYQQLYLHHYLDEGHSYHELCIL